MKTDKYEKIVEDAITYIDSNFQSPLILQELSDHIHLSTNYINTIFKKATKKTLYNYVLDKRLTLACEYLENSNFSISEIASMVGYSNNIYFTTAFKKHLKLTPTEYRKNKLHLK